jgi:hypothetical protein
MGRFSPAKPVALEVIETQEPGPAPERAPSPPAASAIAENQMLDIKLKLHAQLIEELDLSKLESVGEKELRRQVMVLVGDFARAERLVLNTAELEDLGSSVYDEMMGLGPLEPLLRIINKIVAGGRPARRRIPAHGRRAHARRLALQRRDPPGRRRRAAGLDPQILQEQARPAQAGRVRRAHPEHGRGAGGGRARAQDHDHLRRHRHRQDHAAQRALGLHPGGRAPDHHRGRGRAAAPAAARRAPGDAPRQHRGQGESPSATSSRTRCACAPTASSSARSAARRPSTCSGHEHRPRRLDGDHPRQHAARRHRPPRDRCSA